MGEHLKTMKVENGKKRKNERKNHCTQTNPNQFNSNSIQINVNFKILLGSSSFHYFLFIRHLSFLFFFSFFFSFLSFFFFFFSHRLTSFFPLLIAGSRLFVTIPLNTPPMCQSSLLHQSTPFSLLKRKKPRSPQRFFFNFFNLFNFLCTD